MKTYRIEYEIPPMRMILFAECEAASEAEARAHVATEQPRWKVRKVKAVPSGAEKETR